MASFMGGSGALLFDQSADTIPDVDAFGIFGGEFAGINAMHMHGRRGAFHRQGQRFVETDQFFGFVEVERRHEEIVARSWKICDRAGHSACAAASTAIFTASVLESPACVSPRNSSVGRVRAQNPGRFPAPS